MRPRYLLLLVSVPVFERKLRLTHGVSLYFVVLAGKIYSLHYENVPSWAKVIQDFEESPAKLEEYLQADSLSACMDLLMLLQDSAFRKLERLAKHIDIAEDAIFQGNEKKMVEEISMLTRDVMDFRKVVRPQRSLFVPAPRHDLVTPEVATKWERAHGQPN